MGKNTRKTRWRTLPLNGHESDSEESKLSVQSSKSHQLKYQKFPYSSRSSPVRKFQHESSKSTRSNSTTSEHKTTFNEDEYTRITTPRQDVLFKKGYLNKPKNYQTQTSTGTSSTANSTSTCTPDHQSADGIEGTDLEYESQFVFPNGFIDQNGIYYINSFEPFPVVVYNAPICYPEYAPTRPKRYSTDSVTESMSPNNEESSREGILQDGVGHDPVFPPISQESADIFCVASVTSEQNGVMEETRRIKKRRRRKITRTLPNEENDISSEYTSDDEVFSQSESTLPKTPPLLIERVVSEEEKLRINKTEENGKSTEAQNLLLQSLLKGGEKPENSILETNASYSLKPDAEEFIPRTFRPPGAIPPLDHPTMQFVNMQPNFIPVPFVNHVGELPLPLGIPLNFIPRQESTSILHGLVDNVVPNDSIVSIEQEEQEETKKTSVGKNDIDIAKIVSKLEEAAKQQRFYENKRQTYKHGNKVYGSLKPYSSHQRNRFGPWTNGHYQSFERKYRRIDQERRIEDEGRIESREGAKPAERNKEQRTKQTSAVNSNKNNNTFTSSISESCSMAKDCTVNYSDTLKKKAVKKKTNNTNSNNKCLRVYEKKANEEKQYEQNPVQILLSKVQKQPLNQWISVSSRKRKKGKNSVADYKSQHEEEEEATNQVNDDYLFESFDVNLLQDVVPLTKNQEKPKTTEQQLEKTAKTEEHAVSLIDGEKTQTIESELSPPSEEVKTKEHSTLQQKPKTDNNQSRAQESVEGTETKQRKQKTIKHSFVSTSENEKIEEFSFTIQEIQIKEYPTSLPEETKTAENDALFIEKTTQNSETKQDLLIKETIQISPAKQTQSSFTEEAQKTKPTYSIMVKGPNQFLQKQDIINESASKLTIGGETKTKDTHCSTNDETSKNNEQSQDKKNNAVSSLTKENEIKEEIPTPPHSKPLLAFKEVKQMEEVSKKKKSKIGCAQKRIFITDLNFKTEQEKSETTINKVDKTKACHQTKTAEIEKVSQADIETPEKKNKKKKKKTPKPIFINNTHSASSSITTLNHLDDSSYDFLLESSIVEDFEQKTNVEISQELDRMIQKGMYNNLEEKIRALNVTDDGFFKTIQFEPFESERTSGIKPASFGKILGNTMMIPESIGQSLNIDFSKIKLSEFEAQPSTSRTVFLENLETNELIKSVTNDQIDTSTVEELSNKTKVGKNHQNKSKKNYHGSEQESNNFLINSSLFDHHEETVKKPPIYPITKAVKEWMTKTRENTPDVEILKSPNTIFKEFYEAKGDNDRENEEVTIWCKRSEVLDQKDGVIQNGRKEGEKEDGGHAFEDIEEGIEVYESKYGENMDFLKIKEEIEEKQMQHRTNFPKHGNLPYRAICCSIM